MTDFSGISAFSQNRQQPSQTEFDMKRPPIRTKGTADQKMPPIRTNGQEFDKKMPPLRTRDGEPIKFPVRANATAVYNAKAPPNRTSGNSLMSSTDFKGYLNPAKRDDESSNNSIIYESSESVLFESSSGPDSFGTDAFLADPKLSEGDDDCESDARSAINIEPDHHDYGNRFQEHDPRSRTSFFQVAKSKSSLTVNQVNGLA